MYKINKIGLIAISIIGLSACGSDDKNSSPSGPQGSGEVTYQLTFNAKWNATDFQTSFPSGPHFSPVVGATHNNQDFLWRTGEPSTPGVKVVAETGGTTLYKTELEAKKETGNVDNIFQGSGTKSPGITSLQFKVNTLHPYVSAISMIAPSPDWFVGIRDVNLYEGNEWLEKKVFDLKLYDAGTDSGVNFSSDNATETEVIKLLTSLANDTDFEGGVHRTSKKVVGTFTLQKVSESLPSTEGN